MTPLPKYQSCPKCGIVVSQLGKHLSRNRCLEQHKLKNTSKLSWRARVKYSEMLKRKGIINV